VKTIPQRELRNRISEVLREAEAGERFVITVSGRSVAELGPPQPRRWVPRERIQEILRTPEPIGLMEDLRMLDTELEDPFERWDPEAR
jgi:prevent-host-death family protein